MHNAQSLAREWGHELVEMLARGSRGHRIKIPIMGSLCATYDGDIVPRDVIPGSGGFASLSDLISEATTGGKQQTIAFHKTGTSVAQGGWESLWYRAAKPGAGGTPAARPGGAVPINTTTGALGQQNAASGDTLHVTTINAMADRAPYATLFYDRIFHASAIDHTIATSQSLTGVPTRYTGTAARGNFAFLEAYVALGATAQNVTLTYVDQDGNTAEAAPAKGLQVGGTQYQIVHDPYFIPLNAADTGLRNATAVQFSAGNTAGTSNLVIGHPLAWFTEHTAYIWTTVDGINSSFNLPQVQDDACVAFLSVQGQAGGISEITGEVIMVSG
jgi:hypothetical protein